MDLANLLANAELFDAQGPMAAALQAMLPFVFDLFGRGAVTPDAALAPADGPRLTHEWLANEDDGDNGGGEPIACTVVCTPPPPPPS